MKILISAVTLIATTALVASQYNPTTATSTVEPAPAATAAKNLKIDGGHSSVLFRIKHNKTAYFYGRFNEISGGIVYDEADPSKSSVEISIKAASVDTNSEGRDKHILSPDFLDAKQFPTLEFKSTKIQREGAVWQATGDLKFHGTQQEVTLEFEKTGEGKGRRGENLFGFHTRFTVDRTEWGMEYMVGPLGEEIEITVSLETAES